MFVAGDKDASDSGGFVWGVLATSTCVHPGSGPSSLLAGQRGPGNPADLHCCLLHCALACHVQLICQSNYLWIS